jgi:hypothetical protein
MLKKMNKSHPSVCDKLITRLEVGLANVHTPGSADMQQNAYDDLAMGAPMDMSWQIFDRSSLQQMMYQDWPAHTGADDQRSG